LQSLRRPAEGLHEELRGTDLQVRVSDVHEVLQEVTRWRLRVKGTSNIVAAAAIGLALFEASPVAAESPKTLSGAQIRARLTGMQLTDEVHYRFVYERDGTLRSYSMGVKKVGKWTIEKDQLCLYLEETDDGCYQVTLSGERIEMTPSGLGGALDGILQPADRN
jgi:hypothetical protein